MRNKTKTGRAKAPTRARMRSVSPVTALASLPGIGGALAPISGVGSAQMGFQDGTDGKPSLTWARYQGSPRFTAGFGPWYGAPGAEISYERAVAASVTTDLLTSNTAVAPLVENFAVYAIGNGLTLSARPKHDVLGISPEAARALSHVTETK